MNLKIFAFMIHKDSKEFYLEIKDIYNNEYDLF